MASFNYTQKIDTLTTVAIDEATKDVANLVTEGGEKLLKKVQSKGRIFVVNDAEKVKHPVLYGSGTSQYFDPDTLAPSSATGLGTAADEILAFAQFQMLAATRNINYPQAMPPGNFIPYVSSAIKMHMMDILNKEEKLFLCGIDTGTSGTEEANYPLPGDKNHTTGLPMSASALINNKHGSSWPFAGIDTNESDFHNFRPHLTTGAGGATPTEAQLFGALDNAILSASHSESERPDWILTTKAMYKYILDLMRDKSRINDAVLANLGTTNEIPYAGTMIDWSRYLANDVVWDASAHVPGGSAGSAEVPVIGFNTNSLRLNVVAGGGVSDEKLGFVQKVGSTQTHAALTNLFDRVQYKRCWSIDGGRRSFFQIEGWSV
jgi:hypothetical protein